jgi:hypothetical protein
MAFRTSALMLALVLFAGVSPQEAWAKPKHTSFETMIEDSAAIVVARFLDDPPNHKLIVEKRTVQLEILHVLKGNFPFGKQAIAFDDRPSFGNKGDEFVAFLDKNKVWRFMASPLDGKKVDNALLKIEGFYDYNAHWVTPALVTVAQLKKYLKDKTLDYQFRGEVYFPQEGKAAWAPGSLTVSGSYDAVNKKALVMGLPELKGIAGEPEVIISSHGWWREGVTFSLEYARNLVRPLTLVGKPRGVDPKTGELQLRFAVVAPEVLKEKTFEEYLADPECGPPYFKFKLACTPTKGNSFPKVVYLYERKFTERQWKATRLEGYGKTPLDATSSSSNGKKYELTLGELSMVFDIEAEPQHPAAFSWTFQAVLPYTIYRKGSAKGSIRRNDQTLATFTATLDAVSLNREEKGRK